jgi:predicted transcriptional regulator
MATTSRTSKTYTISLPPDLASKAEFLARRDSRSMSELFREAFRAYYTRQSQEIIRETDSRGAARRFRPISVEGEPVSATILRDRGSF